MTKRIAAGLLLAAGLVLFFPVPALSRPEVLKWSPVNIPVEGRAGGWVLAAGSDVQHLTIGADSSLYCYANPAGSSSTLFKSTDGGYSWSSIGKVSDSIVAIATATSNPGVIAYATLSKVYRSTDGGKDFVLLPSNPGGTGSNDIEITSIAIVQDGGNSIVAAGTRDTDSAEFGGVYIFDESSSLNWADTSIGNYDVYAVAFSPDFATDAQLVAVVTDETDTLVTSRIGDGAWGQRIGNARLNRDNSLPVVPVNVDTSACIAFPPGYCAMNQNQALFIGIDAGAENGDIYRINQQPSPAASTTTDLNIGEAYGLNNVDVTSVATSGRAGALKLIAGAGGSAQVYYSSDGGATWTKSDRPPTGQSKTFVSAGTEGRTYAATSGAESGFSQSTDGGVTWSQTGLIDTAVSNILDLTVSPHYQQDSAIFLLTFGGKHSLWRTRDSGTKWERVLSGALAGVDSMSLISFTPGATGVFVSGVSNGKPVLWKSTDNGQNFAPHPTHDSVSSATFNIDAWAIADDNTLLIGSYDGSNGTIYRTSNSGLSYNPKTVVGTSSLYSLSLSANYEQDQTLLAGDTSGWVFWSDDGGSSFDSLPAGATSPPLSGNITVAFDPDFPKNHTVYAASDTANKGIYRFIISQSTSWESIDSTLPTGALINQLLVSPDGVLYASNSKARGGMERCLNPTFSLGPTSETVTSGLDSNATLLGLWRHSNQLWSIDTTNNRLMTYVDSLTQPPALKSPPDNASGVGTRTLSLDWQALSGTTKYRWQIDSDTDFSSVPAGFEGDSAASSARLPALELATTYYWRIRATEPVLSPWSEKWSFITSLGSGPAAPRLLSPEAGARVTATRPLFQWDTVAGAETYELLVATDTSFSSPVIACIGENSLPATAWQSTVNLNHDTAYYWKVRACNAETYSSWSAVSAFVTEPAPTPATPAPEAKSPLSRIEPSEPPSPPSPASNQPLVINVVPPSSAPSTPDGMVWLTHIAVALLVVMVAILVTLIMLVIRIRRP